MINQETFPSTRPVGYATTNPTTGVIDARQARPYHTQVAGILTAAFTISVGYTLYNWIAGTPHGASDVRDPVLWGFYAFGFGLVPLARLNRPWTWRFLAASLVGLIALGLFYYPTVFTPEVQSTIGWLENDTYMGLLFVAAYLCVQRLRNIAVTPAA